jgi:hypothetical protein
LACRKDICILAVCCVIAGAAHGASNVVQYRYDAAGNIVTIDRVDPAPITLSAISPSSGSAGAVVAIAGSGFSPTPAANAVAFNGVAATVVAASATSITAIVPPGAITGKVTVRVAGNTATSAQDFVVATTGAPTISSFTPASGVAGTVVTVNGTSFDPATGATAVRLNQSVATTSSMTAMTLAFAVPANTGSGRIRVTTPTGTASSASDFIVPPGGIAGADILATARLVADGAAQSVGLYATNKYGLVLFEGAAGAWLSLHVANFTVNPAGATIAYAIYKPDNTQLASGLLVSTNLSIHVPALPMAGTYSMLLRTGLAQVALDAKLETNPFVPADGSTLSVTRSAGQSTRALIAAVAGEQKAMMVAGLVTAPVGGTLDCTIALPSGSTFRRSFVGGLGATTALPTFAVTGTHTVVVTPPAGLTQTAFKLALLEGVAIPVDGAAADVAIANPGEGARLTFAGAAGENLGLGITGVTLAPASVTTTDFYVFKPDASLFTNVRCAADGTQCAMNLENLPVTGTYTIIVQPSSGATGMQRLWLSHDVTGSLAAGAPLGVTLARPGQNARLTFAGTAGAVPALQVRAVATSPPGQGLSVQVRQPTGSSLVYTHVTGAGQTLVTPALPVTGTYAVFIEPESAAKGAATATMEVLLDPGQTLASDGPTQNLGIAVAGGTARLLFAGTAGQNLGLGVSNFALTPPSDAGVSVYKPDGTPLAAYGCSASARGCGANLLNLPATGTYSVVVQPTTGATGSFGVTLSSELGGALAVGGPELAINLDRPGRNARIAFAGSAGQTLRLSWSGVAIAGAPGNAVVSVIALGGSTMGTVLVANGTASSYDLPALPATGSYALFVDPPAGATLNATLHIVTR